MKNARRVAFDVLKDVRTKEAYANLALKNRLAKANLSARDAGLATELASGALRLRATYDRIIELASKRKITALDKDVLDVLRLGTHQLLNTRVALHAAVNESVNLTKHVGRAKAAGFVNAVLRKISAKTLAEWIEEITANAKTPEKALEQTYSHPGWIIDSFKKTLEAEERATEIESLLTSDNAPPRVALAALTAESQELLAGESASRSDIQQAGPSPLGYELQTGDPGKQIEAVGAKAGTIRVQDQGSQLAALALVNATAVTGEEKWLDLCAGPGGKTAVLAAEAIKINASLRANEIAPHRAELVKDAIKAFSDDVEVQSFDGRDEEAYAGQKYDRIMIDAPCSGLGALRRRPEARWRKTEKDLLELTSLQGELLSSAAKNANDGAVIAYVTCSPDLRETREIVDEFLAQNKEFIELDAKETVRGVAREELDLGDAKTLSAQLWPHRHGTDAMFISLLRKKK